MTSWWRHSSIYTYTAPWHRVTAPWGRVSAPRHHLTAARHCMTAPRHRLTLMAVASHQDVTAQYKLIRPISPPSRGPVEYENSRHLHDVQVSQSVRVAHHVLMRPAPPCIAACSSVCRVPCFRVVLTMG